MGAARIALFAFAGALAWTAAAQERPPLQFAPDEVSLGDGGAPPATAPADDGAPDHPPAAPPAPPANAPATTNAPSASTPATGVSTAPDATAATTGSPATTPAAAVTVTTTAPRPNARRRTGRDDAPPPPAVPPRVTLHAWAPEPANRFAPEETIEAAMGEVLAADARLRFTPLPSLLQPPDAPAKALDAADRALADAKQAYADMDLDKAKQLLQTALKTYQQWLPVLVKRPGGANPMRDGWVLLAEVRFFDGNPDGARDALRYAFVLDGTLKWNKALFPPQMKKVVVEARLLYDTLGSGRLVIESDPPGATVWLNGMKLPDLTPTQPIDAPPGPNFISYARRGYAPMTLAFEVTGGGEEAHPSQTLQRYPHNPLAPIDRARAVIDDGPSPPTLPEACAQLGVDMLVLVKDARPGQADDEQPSVLTAWLYDARARRIINRLEMRVEGDLQATARVLAHDLFDGVRLDGVWLPPRPPERPRWHQRLWSDVKYEWGRFRGWKGFWYVVGGVAGAAVVGTVAGAAAWSHTRTVAADTVILGGQ